MNNFPSHDLQVIIIDPVAKPIDTSEFKEEYRQLFNQIREHYKQQLRQSPRLNATPKPEATLAFVNVKSRGAVKHNGNYHYTWDHENV